MLWLPSPVYYNSWNYHGKHEAALVKWFLAAYFFSINKDGISEVALAKYISVTLKTAWAVLHKLRNTPKEREALYKLCGSVEMDEAFFGGKHTSKRGRGSE